MESTMNLLQSVLGGLLGGGQQASGSGGLGGPLLQMAMNMLTQGGGQSAGGLLDQLRQAGLGNAVDSWIGSGQNQAISAEQLQSVLGSDKLAGMASALGLDADQVSGQLSQLLPELVDKLTPQGTMPEGGFGNADALMGMLQSVLKR
jgi:uncharacterized protein YidB (DUF937 family)